MMTFQIVPGPLTLSELRKIYRAEATLSLNNDAWEIGTGVNYSINQLFNMFKEKYNIDSVTIPDQQGNYRETLRLNDDLINLLNWEFDRIGLFKT